MRAAAHLQRDHAADLELVPDPAVASRAETSEAQTEIARAVSFLPESSRELIRLHFQEGHSKVEIAAQRVSIPLPWDVVSEKVIGELRGSLRSSSPKARRIVTLLATISSVSFATSASAAPAPVIATPGPLHVRVLTFFLEGLGIMGTTGKITAVATAAASSPAASISAHEKTYRRDRCRRPSQPRSATHAVPGSVRTPSEANRSSPSRQVRSSSLKREQTATT